ncbi:unnamed protein product [Closterium sp. NIES-54]
MRMAGVQYSTASYHTHVIKGLTSSYNLLKRLPLAPSTRTTLNEDSLTSYILQDEAMQEAERPLEPLAQVNYVASVKQEGRPGQRGHAHDGGRGPAGDRLGDEVDAGQAACEACTRHHEHHSELVKHEVATGLDLESASGPDLLCVSCVGGKLARHTFPDLGSDAKDVLAVVHVDLPFAKNSDALQEFVQWLAVVERQTKKSVLMLRSHRGGEFLGNQFTDFVNGKGIVHDLTCPYTPQQNGMAEREMRTVVESVRTMLLHIGVQHHWWHLALRQAAWVRNCLERSTLEPGTTPYQLLTEWGLHLGVSAESKGWELLYLANNRVVTTSDVVFYENMSLEVWKSEHGPALGRMPSTPPTDTSTGTLPLLPEVGEPAAEDVEDASSPSPSSTPPVSPLVADLCRLTPVSASGDEGSSGASPNALTKSIAGGRRNVQQVDMRVMSTPAREERTVEVQLTMVKSAKGAAARQQPTGEHAAAKLTTEKSATGQSTGGPTSGEQSAGTPTVVQQDNEGSDDSDDGGEAVESTDSDVVEVQGGPRHTGRLRRPPDFFVPAAFTTMYDVDADDLAYNDAEDNDEMPEIDPDMPTLSTVGTSRR